MKRLIMLVVGCILFSMRASDVAIAVCGLKFSDKDLEKIENDEVCPGMVLCSRRKLRVSGNVTIESSKVTDKTTAGIYAHHDMDIELMPGSFLHINVPLACDKDGKPKTQYGIAVGTIGGAGSGGLHIYGPGTLSITYDGEKGDGIATRIGSVMVTDGASVRVQMTRSGVPAIEAGVPESSSGKGGLSVVGALLETTGGIFANENGMFLDRAVVNVLSHGSGLRTWGNMTMHQSFCTSIAKSGNALYTRKVLNLDNSIVYALSKEDTCVYVTYDTNREPSTIGKGLYKFATLGGEGKYGINFELPLTFDGGQLVTCAPDGYGIHSVLYTLTMNSGLIRNQDSMHIKDEFFVSRELMEAYDFTAGWKSLEYETEFDPYSAIESFLGDTLPNWIEAESIDNPIGQANWMVSANNLKMNGGTILTENTKYGMCFGLASGHCKVSGGSLQPPIKHSSGNGETYVDSPVDEDGSKLVCVTNAVNEEAYAFVGGGWTAKLPPDYDTSSLFLDGQSSLYFWVLPEYVEPTSFTVTFKANGGTGTMDAQTFTQGVSQGLSLNSFYRSGHTFAGWATDTTHGVAYSDGQIVTMSTNTTLYAVWDAVSVLVTFDNNYGGVKSFRTVKYGEAVGLLPTPTRSGYTFAGWYTAANGGTRISSTKMVTANVTYYAHWKENDGGSLPSGGGFSLSGAYQADRARTLAGAVFRGDDVVGVVMLKVGKKNKAGVFKLSGTLTTLDGKKHTIKSAAVAQGYGVLAIQGIAVRDYGALTLKLAANGFTGTISNGWTMRTANVNTLPAGTLTFDLKSYPTGVNGVPVKTEYLPGGQKLVSTGTKLLVPRAGRVSYRKGALEVSKGGEGNPSGLKLTYAARTGTLKGSFNFYTFNGTKLAKYTAKLTGVTVDGKGYMIVTMNRFKFTSPIKATLAR